MIRGSHPSTRDYIEFLREEFATMIEQHFWIILPYSCVESLPYLRISPMGVVPQNDRRPRTIVDYTFSGINQATVPLAPTEAMQFGRALERLIQRIHQANKRFGPVYMIKVDISDGFYRLQLSPGSVPMLGVVFPTGLGEEPLVALPLVLPMGWVSSPPFFCAITESIADVANAALQLRSTTPATHPLASTADNPAERKEVPRRPTALPLDSIVCVDPTPVAPSTASSEQLPILEESVTPGRKKPIRKLGHLPPPLSIGVPRPAHSQPLQRYVPKRPLAYVDLYMDDFLGLAQGHPKLRDRVRNTIFHSIDMVLRPNDTHDVGTARREPISLSKLNKGDALWSTRKVMLGWIIDSVAETIELPEHRIRRLLDTLHELVGLRRISVKRWQQALGELRSMILAIPGGKGLFSTLYLALSDPDTKHHRIRITNPMRDALEDLLNLSRDLGGRPTRFGEIVDTIPVAYGTADACGVGMGGIWFSPDPTHTPVVWRSPFPLCIQRRLVTRENPSGTVNNSDLELAAQIAEQDILVNLRDCRESTVTTFTDNIAARAWHRKGSRSTAGPSAYLLRLNALHQRAYRYRTNIHYLPGPVNVMADDASRLWHLSDDALLTHFNSTYPQDKRWKLLTLRPEMLSALTTALLCKRSEPASFLPGPDTVIPPGFDGSSIVNNSVSTPCYQMWPIQSSSSKSLPSVTDPAQLHPVANLPELARWKQPFARLARRWPVWGPPTPVTPHKANFSTGCNSN